MSRLDILGPDETSGKFAWPERSSALQSDFLKLYAMSSTGSTTGNNLEHLTLRISSLDNVFNRACLSEGYFGAVYLVTYDGVQCAAKYQDFDDNDRYKPKQFQQECLLHSKLHHPNIVQMIGVCYCGNSLDQPIKIMELLKLSLRSFVYQFQAVPMYVKLTLIQDISRGLDYLHTRNPPIVHSYLRMDVILLTANLVAKIGGFTFSIEMGPETRRVPDEHEIFESALYCGPPFDIFSFGCVICEMVIEECFSAYKYFVNDSIGRIFTLHNISVVEYKYYIDCIEDTSLKQLVTECVNVNPDLRPSALLISEMIAKLIKGEFCSLSSSTLLKFPIINFVKASQCMVCSVLFNNGFLVIYS